MNSNNTKQLRVFADYSSNRISCSKLTSENYIGTDNLLQNKLGKISALYTPNAGATTGYFKGDILIANIRPYLKKIWYATNDGGSSADVLTLRVKTEHDSRYVYYALFRDDFFVHIMKGSKGTKMPRGDKDQILHFLIPDFDLSTQQKIASVLFTIDSKIELNNRVNGELEKMAKTLYDYWFVQFDFPNNNGKPYKTSGGKMVWNEELKREIPEGWEAKTLFEGMDVQYGFPFDTTKFTDDATQKPVIRIRDILENTISTYSTEEVNDKYRLRSKDLLIGMDGNFHLNFWDKDGAYLNQRSVRIRSRENLEVSNFQVLFELTPHIKAREKNVSRTTVGHLSDKDLKRLFVISSKKTETFKPKETFDLLLLKIISNRIQNQKLSELRNWLLPMLMNGQVKVT
ncbi:MAG: restriction endonuclease subunit S [Candidatus Gracilibacteria bacterium]|jgi:type I restriction enzyme S subunit